MSEPISPTGFKNDMARPSPIVITQASTIISDLRKKALIIEERKEKRKSRHWELIAEPTNPSLEALERLKKLGYHHLANKLEKKKGKVWEEILNLTNPVLIEQLYDLECLIALKHYDSDNLFTFGQQIAFTDISDNTQILGKLILALNQNPKGTLKHVNPKNNYETLKWLDKEYLKKVDALKKSLNLSKKPF